MVSGSRPESCKAGMEVLVDKVDGVYNGLIRKSSDLLGRPPPLQGGTDAFPLSKGVLRDEAGDLFVSSFML